MDFERVILPNGRVLHKNDWIEVIPPENYLQDGKVEYCSYFGMRGIVKSIYFDGGYGYCDILLNKKLQYGESPISQVPLLQIKPLGVFHLRVIKK